MSHTLYRLLWDALGRVQLEMMQYPVGSIERRILIEDARRIEMRLAGAAASAQ